MSTGIPFASSSLDWHLGCAIAPCRVGGRLRGLRHASRYGHLAVRSTDRGVPAIRAGEEGTPSSFTSTWRSPISRSLKHWRAPVGPPRAMLSRAPERWRVMIDLAGHPLCLSTLIAD